MQKQYSDYSSIWITYPPLNTAAGCRCHQSLLYILRHNEGTVTTFVPRFDTNERGILGGGDQSLPPEL